VPQKKLGSGTPAKKQPQPERFRLRVAIVAGCLLREVTPKEIADREGIKVSTVQYHFGVLEKEGYLHISRKEVVSGGIRYWYRGDSLNLITDGEFESMGEEERFETSEGVLLHYLRICKQALEEKTLDARPDSHLSHTPANFDQQGWRDTQVLLDQVLERILEITVEAAMRLRQTGEEPISTVVHLAGFEVPASVIEGAELLR
jgi:DNA-binding CsgD family transcriptional regulator